MKRLTVDENGPIIIHQEVLATWSDNAIMGTKYQCSSTVRKCDTVGIHITIPQTKQLMIRYITMKIDN